MPQLIELLAAELGRPRELSARVLNYIREHYSLDDDAIGGFLLEQLPGLEDDEVDLILSPLFTPRLADQAVFADFLGAGAVSRESWPALVQTLAERPTMTELITPDASRHPLVLRDVTIERYVYRLRLDASISEPLMDLIDRDAAKADRPMLKAIARQAVWESDRVRNILVNYLRAAADEGAFNVEGPLELLNLIEARKPAGVDDLLARIPGWQEALRRQIDAASGGKPFFHEHIREMHGGGRDQRASMGLQAAKERELEFLGRLQRMIAR